MKNMKMIPLLSLSLLASTSFGFKKEISSKTMDQIIASTINFVESQQVSAPNRVYGNGEWPTKIVSTALPGILGVGKLVGTDEESSAFSTGAVANVMATIYLDNPELRENKEMQKIPNMVSNAVKSFEKFREGYIYNFYPKRDWKGTTVRQPVDMTLAPMWKGLTNVPEDADSTSTVYAAIIYDAKIRGESYQVPEQAIKSMQSFRDVDRKAHTYNRKQDRKNTGAFLTWQLGEYGPFVPRGWFDDPKKGQRIPFNRNDVDCIVNANVLRMLALNQTSNIEGRNEACNMINDMLLKDEGVVCGIYYPNSFNLGYSAAQMEKSGESCLQTETKSHLVEYILKEQTADGGWDNVGNTWNDRVQSTVFALNTLLDVADTKDRRIDASIRYGTQFLLNQIHTSKEGHLYFKGETFFTATAIARSLVIWTSDSYTTALAANVFIKLQKRFPQYTVQYLEKMN